MPFTLVYDIGNKRYVNLTNACTLQCQFCPKHNGSTQVHDYDLFIKKQPSADDIIVALADLSGIEEVVFCGFGESTLRLLPLLEVAAYVKGQGVPVRVNTDGLGNLVHQRNILPDLAAVVDALSISLNAQNEDVYNQHCKPKKPGAYQAVREFIALAPKYIPKVEVSAIDGLKGVDISACQQIAEASGAQFKRRELDKVG
jgi:TatD family-associated radical SAM protein